MTRNTLLGLSLALTLGLVGIAYAQDHDGKNHMDHNKNGQTEQGRNGLEGVKLDETQLKQVFSQKDYLKGFEITPKIEGDVVTLEGTVPSKAHVIAALLAVYELPGVKHVNCRLNFTEGATGQIGMGSTTGIGEKHEGTTLGAGTGSTKGGDREIEVVASIFPMMKGQQNGSMPAGFREHQVDVIVFRPCFKDGYDMNGSNGTNPNGTGSNGQKSDEMIKPGQNK